MKNSTPLIVQKYGGTSVGDLERICKVAERVEKAYVAGNRIVVVVSAMAGVTDSLIAVARKICDVPDERHLDLLLATGEQNSAALVTLALLQKKVPAVALTGMAAGIQTNASHTKARILRILPNRILKILEQNQVAVVAGFQGISTEDEITTLGRGGSDLTAIALAAALKADICQIYTDVEGVYTADPRVVPNARKLKELTYDEMLELASSGAKVMQARSVELAKKFNIRFEVRSSLTDQPGTIIQEEKENMEESVVRGISSEKKQIRVVLRGLENTPQTLALLFESMGRANVLIDMIVENSPWIIEASKRVGGKKEANGTLPPHIDLCFTIRSEERDKTEQALAELLEKKKVNTIEWDPNLTKISVVGIGIRSHTGVAAKVFQALAEAHIQVHMISTSEIKIALMVEESRCDEAVKVLHHALIE